MSLLVAPSAASTSATPVQAEPTASATPAQGAPSASAGQQATDQTPAAGDQQAGTHTVTAVAAAGAQLDRGDVLFAVDARPTVALVGTEPAFRALAAGVDDGADVAQLEENLAALSHLDGDAVDAHFGPATAAAVEAWQDAMGFPVTGTVELGDIAFLPAPVTVAAAVPAVGDQVTAGGHILDVTGETVLAVGDLPVRARGDVAAGSPTRVTLPDGTSVDGTVRTIAADATRPTGADVTTSTVEVTIQLDVTDSPAALPGADVTLAVTTSTHPAVLTVPVAAIVDGGDGRPAVLLSSASDDEPALVPVDTGTTAGGYVEVAPGPLAEGDPVVLPGRDPADAG